MKRILFILFFINFLVFPISCNNNDSSEPEVQEETDTEEEEEEIVEEEETEEETEEEIIVDPLTMNVKGRFLYTVAGEKVIMRGVNEMMTWSDNVQGDIILPEIAKTGANTIRLVWTINRSPADLDALITNSIKNGMIPMVELHDATGDWSKLPDVMGYWLRDDVKEVLDKHKKWVLLNIANEVGGSINDDTAFVSNYKDAITRLRNKGYNLPLIIDPPGWGQDEGVITRNWEELYNHDPLNNVMFSVHTYWVDNQQQRLENLLNLVVSEEIPFLFGEGPQLYGYDCATEFPYINCIKICQEKEIGWLNWSWGAVNNNDCDQSDGESWFNITTDGSYGNWNNNWGRLTMVDDENSIQNTSVRPQSLLDDADTY